MKLPTIDEVFAHKVAADIPIDFEYISEAKRIEFFEFCIKNQIVGNVDQIEYEESSYLAKRYSYHIQYQVLIPFHIQTALCQSQEFGHFSFKRNDIAIFQKSGRIVGIIKE